MKNKVFCLGSNKTGTMSLTKAMEELGYNPITTRKSYGLYLGKGLNHSKENLVNFFNEISLRGYAYDFFVDIPFSLFDSHIMVYDLFPESYYILTLRDSEKWFDSVLRWIKKLDAQKMYDWIWKTNVILENKNKVINRYNKRNTEIMGFFKNNNKFMALNIEEKDKFKKLSEFLGRDNIERPFPHENKNFENIVL